MNGSVAVCCVVTAVCCAATTAGGIAEQKKRDVSKIERGERSVTVILGKEGGQA
jgi:hypothetical protein